MLCSVLGLEIGRVEGCGTICPGWPLARVRAGRPREEGEGGRQGLGLVGIVVGCRGSGWESGRTELGTWRDERHGGSRGGGVGG